MVTALTIRRITKTIKVLFMKPLPAALCGLALLSSIAQARNDGQWTNQAPEIRSWFNGLANQRGGQCCSFADGLSIDDPDWDVKGNGYRVRIKGEWVDVPPEALVSAQNRIGRAIVWPLEVEGKTKIRCFMPGVEG